eukprot:tig00000215_g18662.t1
MSTTPGISPALADAPCLRFERAPWQNPSSKSQRPLPRSGAICDGCLVQGSTSLILYGGQLADSRCHTNAVHLLDDLHIFDLQSQQWREIRRPLVGEWPPALVDAAGCVFDGALFVWGGMALGPNLGDAMLTENEEMWRFDLELLRWEQVPFSRREAPCGRAAPLALLNGDRWIVFGGSCGSGRRPQLRDMWSFSFARRAWSEVRWRGEGPEATEGAAGWVSEDGALLAVFGGARNLDEATAVPVADAWLFSFPRLAWSRLPVSPDPHKYPPAREDAAFGVVNGRCVLLGGMGAHEDFLSDAFEFSFDAAAALATLAPGPAALALALERERPHQRPVWRPLRPSSGAPSARAGARIVSPPLSPGAEPGGERAASRRASSSSPVRPPPPLQAPASFHGAPASPSASASGCLNPPSFRSRSTSLIVSRPPASLPALTSPLPPRTLSPPSARPASSRELSSLALPAPGPASASAPSSNGAGLRPLLRPPSPTPAGGSARAGPVALSLRRRLEAGPAPTPPSPEAGPILPGGHPAGPHPAPRPHSSTARRRTRRRRGRGGGAGVALPTDEQLRRLPLAELARLQLRVAAALAEAAAAALRAPAP